MGSTSDLAIVLRLREARALLLLVMARSKNYKHRDLQWIQCLIHWRKTIAQKLG